MESTAMKVELYPHFFSEKEKVLAQIGKMRASTFTYQSGVRALRIENPRGDVIVLPFHGQQIWDAVFDGRCIKMRTAVSEPKATQDFLSNMGGFLFHCGMSAMGSPGPNDSHPIHGELVNANYQSAWLEGGADSQGNYLEVGGTYQHSAAFGLHYTATPTARIYEDGSLIHFSMRVRNLNQTPMEYMYLAHINFFPIDLARLVYSAHYDPEHVKIRANFPSHMQPTEELKKFVADLVKDPEMHHTIQPDFVFDPEIVFMVQFEADEDGWAHALQIHPDGSADYVRHKPAQLDHGIRWICRTPNQQALGMEPGTAGVEGFSAEKAKGNVKILAPGAEFFCEYAAGLVDPKTAAELEMRVDRQMGRK
jgi:hypothetical protein